MGPVRAAFLGCQQMEMVLEKSVNTAWMIGNYLFLYTQERSLKKKKGEVHALEPTVRTHPPTNDKKQYLYSF